MAEVIQTAFGAMSYPTWTEGAAILAATAAFITSLRNGNKIAHVEKVAVATHALSNSAMEAQLLANVQNLELAAVAFHRLAESGIQGDIDAAKAIDKRIEGAKDELNAHKVRQAAVDAAPM